MTTDQAQPPECVEMTRNKTLVWPLVKNVSFCARLLFTERARLGVRPEALLQLMPLGFSLGIDPSSLPWCLCDWPATPHLSPAPCSSRLPTLPGVPARTEEHKGPLQDVTAAGVPQLQQ